MSEIRTVTCGCGQTTHMEMQDGVEIYVSSIHGTYNEPARGRCFNCHKVFGTDVPMAEKVVGSGVTEPIGGGAGTVEKALGDMSLKELKATAKAEAIPIPGLRSKVDIAAEIRAVRAERAAEPGDEDID